MFDLEVARLCARKTLVPWLMLLTARAFLPGGDFPAFWRGFATHWFDVQQVQSSVWTPQFEAKAARLRAGNIAVLTPLDSLPTAARDIVDRWDNALHAAARAFSASPDPLPATPLASQFTHLMNNRIGLLPIEEAYFATLLAEQVTASLQ